MAETIEDIQKAIRRKAPLVHRGVVIQPPAVAPTTSLARIRRGARIAVQQYLRERGSED